jgi:hypothetical protein
MASISIIGCMDSISVAPKIAELGTVSNAMRLERGRSVYITSCSRCHNAVRITRITKSKWDEILPEMIEKSKLTSSDSMAVTEYIRVVLNASASTAAQPSKSE